MSTPRRFPELAQLETKEERRAVYLAAMKKVSGRPRYWIFFIVGIVFTLNATNAFISALVKRGQFIPLFLYTVLIGGPIVASIFFLLRSIFHRAIEKEIRLEMIARGLSVCMGCGYDLRGQIEARCPECGLAFSREGG